LVYLRHHNTGKRITGTIQENDDNSLTGTNTDLRIMTMWRKISGHHNPRKSAPYFNNALFLQSRLASSELQGDASFMARYQQHRSCASEEVQLFKETLLHSEQRHSMFFNHAQFNNPSGNFNDSHNFGFVNRRRIHVIMQIALKVLF